MASVFSISIDDEDQPLIGPRSGAGAGAGAAPAFSPLDIAALKLWLEADAGTNQTAGGAAAVADGDPVGEWLDQSGNGKHMLQATSTMRGTLKTGANGQNGRAVVRGDGVDDFLASSSVASTAVNNFTAFLVYKPIANTGSCVIFSNGTAANGVCYFTSGGNPGRALLINAVNAPSDGQAAFGVFDKVNWKRQAGVMSFRANGVSETLTSTTDVPNTPTTTSTIFNKTDGLFSNCDIAALLFYDAALTLTQIQQLEAYLDQRWGFDHAIIYEGDSLTVGYLSSDPAVKSYPAQIAVLDGALRLTWKSVATMGATFANAIPSRTASPLTSRITVPTRSAVICIGTNDIGSGRSSAQINADIDAWITSIRAYDAGAKLIGCTLTPRTDFGGPEETKRLDVNTHIKSVATFDYTVDFAADNRLDDPTDLTYYNGDGIHNTDAGYLVRAELVKAVLDAHLLI